MIFQKNSPKSVDSNEEYETYYAEESHSQDEVETVVGPSVNVEGDFASEGNIIVKGTVAGSVTTSRHLSVEPGARIMANVRAGTARIAGEVRGNIKLRESLELTATARIVGDIEAKILVVEAGALVLGKINMPGLDAGEGKSSRSGRSSRKVESIEVAPAEDQQ